MNIDIREIYDRKERVWRELGSYFDKSTWSASDVDMVFKLADIFKDLCKAAEHAEREESGYSQAGDWRADIYGTYGNSYQNRDSMGRYSRTGGNGSYRGNYSMGGDPRETLRMMLENARTEKERDGLRRALEIMQ